MELAAQEPGVVGDFHDLDVDAVRSASGDAESGRSEGRLEFTVKFVPMAMALGNLGGSVGFRGKRIGLKLARPRSQAHRTAHFVDSEKFAKLVNHAIGRGGIELG